MTQFVVPKRAKAIIYSNPGTTATEIIDVDVPEPQAGEILINITHSGVCHTDYSLITNSLGHMPVKTPVGQIGGHEGVGIVVKLGPGVTTHELGDRVGVKWITSACLTCEACLYGEESRCAKRKVSGFRTPGTFQQYLTSDAQYVTPIPEGVDSAKAAPLLCAGVTVYVALQKAGLKPGQWVALSGAGGGLGSLALQYAKTMGLHVLAVDHGSKEDFCKELGADAFIDFTNFNDAGLIEETKRLTKGGAHAILVSNSSSKAYDQAMDLLRFGGTLVCVGLPEANADPIGGAIPASMIMRSLTIKGLNPKFCNASSLPKALSFAFSIH
jgi:propanol-preferring alcohol dehydrogenase